MEKNNKNSESVQTAPEQKIIEIANKCASEVWGCDWKPNFKVVRLERNGVTIRMCDGNEGIYSITIEGGSVVYINLNSKWHSLEYTDLKFINEMDECADEITEITFEVKVA